MKKLLILSVLMAAFFVFVGCGSRDKIDDSGSLFDDKETLLGFAALSSVMTLDNNLEGMASHQSPSSHFLNAPQDDTFAILSEIDDLTPYLELVSTFMGSGSNFDVTVTDSDYEDYDHKMDISTINMEGNTVVYTLHYNETFDNEDDEDFDPEEADSILDGIMIIDGVTYTLYGERQTDEGEESLELTAKIDDENYVTLDYEIEIDSDERSIEFMYEMFINGQLVMSIEIDFEEDAEETELSLKFMRERAKANTILKLKSMAINGPSKSSTRSAKMVM